MKINKEVIVDPNAYGGHNDFCRSLALLLSGKDSEILYINREFKSDNAPEYRHIPAGYPDHSFRYKIKSYINIYWQLKKFIENGYAIHFQDITPYMIPVVSLLLLLPKNNKNFYLTLHNIKPHDKSIKSRIEYKLVYLLLCLNAFKKVFYHFEFIKMEDELAMNNIPEKVRKKMVFVPHHIMFHNKIQNTKIKTVCDRAQEIVILFFGVVRQNKGVREFFSLLANSNINTKGIKFIVAGAFEEYSASILQHIVDQSKYKINLQIESGFIEDQKKDQLFNMAHYILLPYLNDFLAQSGVVIDAYQNKIPLIVSSNPSLKYLVTHEKTGYLYNQDSLKSLLEQDIFDQKKYALFVQNINKVLEEKYSNDHIRSLYMHTYSTKSVQ